MDDQIIVNMISSIIVAIIGLVIGYFFKMFLDRKIAKDIKYDEISVNDELNDLKCKLEIYWNIYFKLLICLSAKTQIDKIKMTNQIDMKNMINLEQDIIVQNLDEIVKIITQNIRQMDLDDIFLDLVLRFISHVLAYKSYKKGNITHKMKQDYGLTFPDDFTKKITERTFYLDAKYRKHIGSINLLFDNKLNLLNQTNQTNQLNSLNQLNQLNQLNHQIQIF